MSNPNSIILATNYILTRTCKLLNFDHRLLCPSILYNYQWCRKPYALNFQSIWDKSCCRNWCIPLSLSHSFHSQHLRGLHGLMLLQYDHVSIICITIEINKFIRARLVRTSNHKLSRLISVRTCRMKKSHDGWVRSWSSPLSFNKVLLSIERAHNEQH